MTPRDALLEIGTEELPAAFITLGIEQLRQIAETSLKEYGLGYKGLETYGTPRRLAVLITEIAAQSDDQQKTIFGPPAAMAKDAQGHWTPAAQGFARKQGVDPSELEIQNDRLCTVQHLKGRGTKMLLTEAFPRWIAALEFPKSMVWEPSRFRFPRPIRWLTALYGQDLVSFSLAGVKSARWSLGLAIPSPKKIAISHPGKYVTQLKNQCVLVEPESRQEAIRRLTDQAVRRVHGHALVSPELLKQVGNLVEHPVAVLGAFDPAYLALPHEVLITCLEHHQRFFPVQQAGGGKKKLLPNFVGIRNGMSVHQEIVREGYERVLAARLADAKFFFGQDRKKPLSERVEMLRGVTFQHALGSLFDKKERVKGLIERIATMVPGDSEWRSGALRVAELCKADLVTDMVREFPELQGVMARIYAQASDEPADVALALEEHYWPLTLSGQLPSSDIAAVASLADKMDTLAADFAVGLIPTGSADPYGLRRAAVGILRILEAKGWPIALEALIDASIALLPDAVRTKRPTTRQDLIGFMRQRLSALLEDRGYKADEIDAVMGSGIGTIVPLLARLKALHDIRRRPEVGPLSAAFKRAANIIRQARQKNELTDTPVRPDLLQEPSEKALATSFDGIQKQVRDMVSSGRFAPALEAMVGLRVPLDEFFTGVMVMAEDKDIRANRLALLAGIVDLFLSIADFGKLQASQ